MERGPDHVAAPWRVIGEPARAAAEPDGPGGGASLPILIGGIVATVLLAIIAFALAMTSADGAVIRIDGAETVDGAVASPADGGASADLATAVAAEFLVIDVGGAVAHPGVYRFTAGARVGDAIAAAGGFGARVDTARASADLNLAAVLHDGDRIRVPSRDDPPAGTPADVADTGSGTTGGGSGSGGLVDLNRATQAELEALPGIGPVLAGRIIDSRAEQPFRSVDELRGRGILGAATFAKVEALVVVR